jgi:YNFM family putative membrane transporter
MQTSSGRNLHIPVFFLVMSAIANVYITQPVLPIIQREFGTSEIRASFTISAVILGIALSNLPFGMLADRIALKPIIVAGGLMVSLFGFVCAATSSLDLLITARFFQGVFLPALTTCLAAYLARNLPAERLNVVMGSYVSATVAGGLGGRLLGGWIHPPLHWRYAFVSAAVLLLVATVVTIRRLPAEEQAGARSRDAGFLDLLKQGGIVRMYLVAFTAFFVFSSIFNYLPFYLSSPPFSLRTEVITLLYLAYITGIAIGPLAGRLSNRLGNGSTLIIGSTLFSLCIALTLIPSAAVIAISLAGICGGFFGIHAAAVGALNRKLTTSQGRANSLYVLFYYLGGAVGITVSGFFYSAAGWDGVTGLGMSLLLVPLLMGIVENRTSAS